MRPARIDQLLSETARRDGSTPAWRSRGETATFAQAAAGTERVAAALFAAGVRRGDRVALVSENRIEALRLLFACSRLGAIFTPLNLFLRGSYLQHQLRDAEPSLVVVDGAGYETVVEALRAVRMSPQLVSIEQVGRWVDDEVAGECPEPGTQMDDPVAIVYTSGTTGSAKGCVISHGYLFHLARATEDAHAMLPGDVLFTFGRAFHLMGLICTLTSLHLESTLCFEETFSPRLLLDQWRSTGTTVFMGVGAMGAALLATPAAGDDRAHSVRVAVLFPFDREQTEAFESRFGIRVASEVYGQTECVPVTYRRPDAPGRTYGAIGKPAPFHEVGLHDDDDRPVPVGDVGEIVVRPKAPHQTFSGYWRNDAATLASWAGLWHHTGDLARELPDGTFVFVDRKKDALRRRGENISSVDLENVLLQHPAISEAAVHGVASPVGEDDIKACLVLVDGPGLEPVELFEFLRDRVPYYCVPRYVELVASLPRTATARIMKESLRRDPGLDRSWDLETMGLTVDRSDRR